jgi:DNA-binding transcriptional MerR regulator
MKQPRKKRPVPRSVFKPDPDAVYTLDVVVELTGLPAPTILHYEQEGLVTPAAGLRGAGAFNDEGLRTLRRIEHLRTHYEMTLQGLRLTLGLLEELERLRAEIRSRR